MRNLDVLRDYAPYTLQDMTSSLTATLHKPGDALLKTCIKTIKMGILWLRPSTNTLGATFVNIYNTAHMCGAKLQQHSAEIAWHGNGFKGNERFLLKLIRQSLICFMTSIPRHLPRPQVIW